MDKIDILNRYADITEKKYIASLIQITIKAYVSSYDTGNNKSINDCATESVKSNPPIHSNVTNIYFYIDLVSALLSSEWNSTEQWARNF